MLLHAVLPPLYALAFIAVVLLQLLTGPWADPLMVWLERRRASSWAAYAQAGVLRLGERPETRGAARHVGRLFVCGYFVVEGGLLFGGLAVLAFALPRRLRFATYGLLPTLTLTLTLALTTDPDPDPDLNQVDPRSWGDGVEHVSARIADNELLIDGVALDLGGAVQPT